MKKRIPLTQACDGLVRYQSATGMSPNTIRNYRTTFAKLQAYFDSHPERSCILSGGPQAAVEGAAESKDPAFEAITRDPFDLAYDSCDHLLVYEPRTARMSSCVNARKLSMIPPHLAFSGNNVAQQPRNLLCQGHAEQLSCGLEQAAAATAGAHAKAPDMRPATAGTTGTT
jgi:hypothetical protein